jgi:dipeptidyl-peptidase-4
MIKSGLTLALLLICSTIIFGQDLSVEKIWKEYAFFGSSVNGFRSMQDGNYFSKVTSSGNSESVTRHKFTDSEGAGDILIPVDILADIDMDDYAFNADESKALIMTGSQQIYRRSFSAIYYLYDRDTKALQRLDEKHEPQTLAEYSPDGQKVSYIFENNLYIKEIATGNVTQLTNDGKRNAIINGTTDWVYEEEFSLTKGYGWSPDSKCIAYLKFDESEVPEFNLTYFYELYPDLYTFKYPKAGEDNSHVSAHIVHLTDQLSSKIDLGEYEYIPRLKWSSESNHLVIQTLNRHQNHLKYHLVDLC